MLSTLTRILGEPNPSALSGQAMVTLSFCRRQFLMRWLLILFFVTWLGWSRNELSFEPRHHILAAPSGDERSDQLM